jgi:uncharacterized protein (TIGR03085 family)
MHPTLGERAALCDLLDELGPDAPTRCEGWTTTELTAHLRMREHRPDSLPGLLGRGPFATHTARLERKTAERPFGELVADLRDGPPAWWFGRWIPDGDLHEWFVHHEDVRRANGGAPRTDDDLDDAIWKILGRWGKALTRRADVGIELVAHDGRRRTAKADEPAVTLTGRPGELLLTLFGRDAEVVADGTDEALAAYRSSTIGL